ncbi:MAG: glycerol-3-phosphate 1-O-acyltransferase PlsY [Clostridia bacterium]|nr:glycerol-3-phosphate 1-O-acyltransferase PlsY [Clostridia bacterium]
MVVYVIVAIIAYLIGSINFSVLISKKMAGFDVREKGSGNAGTTNVLRTVGKRAAALTLLLDILKGIVAILVAVFFGWVVRSSNSAVLVEIAAICVVIGHTFPIFFGFKGGKGVATSLGILLFINWKIGIICIVFGVFLIAITRMVSLGSISGAVLFAVLTIFIRDGYIVEYNYSFIIFGLLLAAIVIINHRANLKRIIDGNENRISFKKKPVEEEKKEEKKPKEEEVKVSEPEEIKIEVKPEASETEKTEDTEEKKD